MVLAKAGKEQLAVRRCFLRGGGEVWLLMLREVEVIGDLPCVVS